MMMIEAHTTKMLKQIQRKKVQQMRRATAGLIDKEEADFAINKAFKTHHGTSVRQGVSKLAAEKIAEK